MKGNEDPHTEKRKIWQGKMKGAITGIEIVTQLFFLIAVSSLTVVRSKVGFPVRRGMTFWQVSCCIKTPTKIGADVDR